MLYSIIHKLPIWQDIKESTRNVQTFILATIIYIVLVGTIQSGVFDNTQYGNFLRNNIYSIWMIDALYLAISYYYESSEQHDEEDNNIIKKRVEEEQLRLENMTEQQNVLNNQSLRRKIFTKSDEIYSEVRPDPHKKVNKVRKVNNVIVEEIPQTKSPNNKPIEEELIQNNESIEEEPIQNNASVKEEPIKKEPLQNNNGLPKIEEESDDIPIYQS